MKKNLWMVAAFVMGMAMSVTLTSCGDDDEPTPTQQNEGNGNDNGNGGSQNAKTPAGVVAVDLGLPSGTLWANMNIGATNPEDYGDYFAWGETEGYKSGKTGFDWASYKYCNGSENTMTKYCNYDSYGYNGFTDNLTELVPEDDAATANWGVGWQMPTIDQFQELFNNNYTTKTWTTVNGIKGHKYTSKVSGYVGNFIFLPAVGYRNGSSLNNAGSGGNYWSRTLDTSRPNYARGLGFNSSNIRTSESNRYVGRAVRPVRK